MKIIVLNYNSGTADIIHLDYIEDQIGSDIEKYLEKFYNIDEISYMITDDFELYTLVPKTINNL